MITTLKNKKGYVVSFCEWRLVARSGYEKIDGEYVWVNEIWIHPDFRRKFKLQRVIDEVMRKAPTAKYGYFTRAKYGKRMKLFTKEQWERRRRTYDPMIKEK